MLLVTAQGLRCLDSLLANSQNNFQGDYANGGDNAANIASIFSYDRSVPWTHL
jgi:hypothetical protein